MDFRAFSLSCSKYKVFHRNKYIVFIPKLSEEITMVVYRDPGAEKKKTDLDDYKKKVDDQKTQYLGRYTGLECPSDDIKKYQIIAYLDKGAVGAVYEATKGAALKVVKAIKKEFIREKMEKRLARSIQEKKMSHAMESPFVVKVTHKFKDELNLYLIMEHAEYGSLRNQLDRTNREAMEEAHARRVLSQVACGLEYVHACNIVHRDIKLGNIVVCATGRVKICDFGIATFDTQNLRQPAGTVGYRAPEMLLASREDRPFYSFPVDWFAFGVIAFRLLLADHPFCDLGQGMAVAERNVLEREMRSMDIIPPGRQAEISVQAKDLLSRLLRKDPVRRIGTGVSGSQEVKNHAWFKDVSYHRLIFAEDGFFEGMKRRTDFAEFVEEQPFINIGPCRDQAFKEF